VSSEEGGFQHVRVTDVPALCANRDGWCAAEIAASVNVQDAAEHRRGVEAAGAQPVDGAVARDQRRGVAVADDLVISEWRIPAGHVARHGVLTQSIGD
jgi:hypothetical protein